MVVVVVIIAVIVAMAVTVVVALSLQQILEGFTNSTEMWIVRQGPVDAQKKT